MIVFCVLALIAILGACASGPMTPPTEPPVEPSAETTESEASTQARNSEPEKTSKGGEQSEDPDRAAAESQGQPGESADMQEAGQQASGATTYGLETEKEPGFEQMNAETTAPRSNESSTTGTPPPGGGGETQQEAVARLNRSLSNSLSEFDETLLGAQEDLQARIEEGGGSASRGGGVAEGEYGGSDSYGRETLGRDEAEERMGRGGGATSEREGSRESEDSMQSTGARGGIAKTHDPSGKNVPREDIPDGQDDDIVARQLREAAEQETDPELKERLWEEYRKYKKGSGRRADSS